MSTTTTLPLDLTAGDCFALPVRLLPKRRKAVPAGAVVEVMGILPGPIDSLARLLLWLPHGEARTVPWPVDKAVEVIA